jgi:site-specific DNA-adenine methylase
MKSIAGTLAAPFPWFGGKANAAAQVWQAFGNVNNYVEPFAGSAAMLLSAPAGKRVSTLNDADGFVANFWRAIAKDPQGVADYADWPCNEIDLFARHSWLVREAAAFTDKLHADPEWYDLKIAGWWCWGACNWIGDGWCSGDGPWVLVDGQFIKRTGEGGVRSQLPHLPAGQGITRKLPHLGDAGQGINRSLPRLGDAGRGINRSLPHLGDAGQGEHPRTAYISEWFSKLHDVLRDTRVTCGDWSRVVKDSVTTRHGLTAVFLDPPYTKGSMDYAAKGTGGALADEVRAWCAENGQNNLLRVVLCGHAGEHDELLAHGWQTRKWMARTGYARTDEAKENSASETIWCSPHCMAETNINFDMFSEAV